MMRKGNFPVNFKQVHLTIGYRRPKSCFERINVTKNVQQDIKYPEHRDGLQGKSLSETSSDPRCLSSHDCVRGTTEVDTISGRKSSQRILVSSALRRPHASLYSHLDSQTLPEHGRRPRQPYRPKSASTVYSYAERPVSACEASKHLGRPTKASLLRSKSSVEILPPTAPSRESVNKKKKACVLQEEVSGHQNLFSPKEVFDCMLSAHSYLTGARYNSCRFVDSKSKDKLGLYVSKDGFNAFIINKPKAEVNLTESDDIPAAVRKIQEEKSPKTYVCSSSTNTEPHFLSINKLKSNQWSNPNVRKDFKPDKHDHRRQYSTNKIKPIKAHYIDYNKMIHVK